MQPVEKVKTSIKMKISMTCVYRAWSWNKNGTWAMATVTNKYLLGGNMKLLFSGRINLW